MFDKNLVSRQLILVHINFKIHMFYRKTSYVSYEKYLLSAYYIS